MLVVGPEIPASLRPFALSVVDAISALQVPKGPVQLWSVAEADLPPATAWPDCALRVSDLDILAVSNGTNWIRQDTGAAI